MFEEDSYEGLTLAEAIEAYDIHHTESLQGDLNRIGHVLTTEQFTGDLDVFFQFYRFAVTKLTLAQMYARFSREDTSELAEQAECTVNDLERILQDFIDNIDVEY